MRGADFTADLARIAVNKAELYARLRSGMLGFCFGTELISHAIEEATGGPSHVLLIWGPAGQTNWLTIEATLEKGVHVGLLSDYINGCDGTFVIAKRVDPATGLDLDMAAMIDAELKLLDQAYAALGLLQEGAHKLLKVIPPNWNLTQKYCSGLQGYGSQSSAVPFPASDGAPTPNDEYIHPSTVKVAALLKGTQ